MQHRYQLICLLAATGLSLGLNHSLSQTNRRLVLSPHSGSSFTLHSAVLVSCMLANSTLQYIDSHNTSTFYIGIKYERSKVQTRNIASIHSTQSTSYVENAVRYYSLKPPHYNFTVDMVQIGYGRFVVSLTEKSSDNVTRLFATELYILSCIRQVRLVDIGFNVAISILATLNTFALGCVVDLETIRSAAEQRLHILIAIITQYIAMPMLTFGLVKILDVQDELALGFLFLTCVPGGGLGYLTVSVTGSTDKQYSVLLNVLQLMVPLVGVPVYVYSLGQLFQNEGGEVVNNLYYLVIWLFGLLIPFAMGMTLKRRKPEISAAFLNWLIKPCLLLAFILFITLGLYINMYVLSVLDNVALVTGGVIPFMGFGIGGALMLLAKQGKCAAKTLAIESAIMNSIVVIVALRFTLPQPDADLASAAAMWVLFFTPVPFVLMFLFHRIKKKVMFHFKKKALEDEQKTTIMNSFAAITHNAMQIGGLDRHSVEDQPPSPCSPMNYENGAESRLLISDSQSFNDHPHAVTNNVNFAISPTGEEMRPIQVQPVS